jgi:hypothetical protein
MSAPRCASVACERFGTVPLGRTRALCAVCARRLVALGMDMKMEPRSIRDFPRPTPVSAA